VTASTTIPYLVRNVVVSNLEQWLGLKEDLVVKWNLPERMWPEKDSDHIRVAVECFDGQGDKLGFIDELVNPAETQYTVPRWNKPRASLMNFNVSITTPLLFGGASDYGDERRARCAPCAIRLS